MSSRRQALAALGAIALPLTSWAQAPRGAYRIGFLVSEAPSDPSEVARFEALRSGLRELGYVEGKSIVIEGRWADGR